MYTVPNDPIKYQTVNFDFNTAANHTILGGVTGSYIGVHSVLIKSYGDVNITFQDEDGSPEISPTFNLDNKAGFRLELLADAQNPHFQTHRGDELRILLSDAVRVTGTIKYRTTKMLV